MLRPAVLAFAGPEFVGELVQELSREARDIFDALGARPDPQQGLLISKKLYERFGGHRGGDADPERGLLRRLGGRRIVMLRSGTKLAAD